MNLTNMSGDLPSQLRISLCDLTCRGYDIAIGSGNLERIGSMISQFAPYSRVVILTDTNVRANGYSDAVVRSLCGVGADVYVEVIAAGERSKSIDTAVKIWSNFLAAGIDRNSILLSVGGGVVGDLGGFVAASYTRGIRFFQVPTTLLAQVDSSVGGKVGVDLPQAKNMVGFFYQPLGVLIDSEVLKTLTDADYICGLGEVAKYAVSLDAELFNVLETNADKVKTRDSELLKYIVVKCCEIKGRIVGEDEFEKTGKRVLLNYGHTFAHAFEIISNFELQHGQAVAIGSIYAAKLAAKLGIVDKEFVDRQIKFHKSIGLPVELPEELFVTINWNEVVDLMRRDKKTESGKLKFVLPTKIGQSKIINDIEPKNIIQLCNMSAEFSRITT
ncbi:MAG: 3-dehydroquinate synthase [Planctomycetaceae bacterium]|jgi:3-dehydroquinate synthase|nr:3-dehydroquinate synthase [Planctomycetaceae bacterium]